MIFLVAAFLLLGFLVGTAAHIPLRRRSPRPPPSASGCWSSPSASARPRVKGADEDVRPNTLVRSDGLRTSAPRPAPPLTRPTPHASSPTPPSPKPLLPTTASPSDSGRVSATPTAGRRLLRTGPGRTAGLQRRPRAVRSGAGRARADARHDSPCRAVFGLTLGAADLVVLAAVDRRGRVGLLELAG